MLTHVATLHGHEANALFGVSDLDLVYGADGSLGLLATSRAGGGITAFSITPAGVASLGAQALFPGGLSLLGGVETAVLDLSGAQVAVSVGPAGWGASEGFWGAEWSAGTLGAMEATPLTTSVLPARLAGIAQIETSEISLLIAAHIDGSITRFRLEPGDTLSQIGVTGLWLPSGARDTSAVAHVTVDGTPFLLATAAFEHSLTSYRISEWGGVHYADSHGAEFGLGMNLPLALGSAEVAGVTYVVVASSGASALSVLELASSGLLTPKSHVLDTLETRFDNVTALAVTEAGGRAWVAAGGSDDGITLFELLAGGRLLERATLPHQLDMTLANVDAITMTELDGALHIFVGSASADGVTQLRYDLGTPGDVIVTQPGADRTDGTAGGDTITGSPGDDQLVGWAGDDVFHAGQGSDTMWAGSGADVFFLEGDGMPDQIEEFDIAEDRIDLSGWGVMSPSQLTIYSTWNGGRVYFEDEYLIVISRDWAPLTPEEITATLLDFSASAPVGLPRSGDEYRGTLGDDTLVGSARDDIFIGLAGADEIIGGGGADTVSYEDSRSSLLVDLWFPHLNTNVAAGDTFDGIDHLIGSRGFDNLRGTLGDNHISGMRNVDFIFGRMGDDTLEGGIGDDVLLGGPGADMLIGGPGRDRAQYSQSTAPLILDLANPERNTGEAAGDSYTGIEDLAGGLEADQLWGDDGPNWLIGREREDTLRGGAGDDYLNGGAHSDRLEGGAGDDVMRGGIHPDTFVFDQGHDVIEDAVTNVNIWWNDFIEIDGTHLWSGARTAAQVIEQYASVVGGQVVFDFGGHSLTIESVATLDGLEEQLIIL